MSKREKNARSGSNRIAGAMVAQSATGPIFRSKQAYSILPLSSVLSALQEVASRIDDHDRPVLSSLAQRVSGDLAFSAWSKLSMQIAGQLTRASPRSKVAFLRAVMVRCDRSSFAPGLESVACSAMNAAWSFLTVREIRACLQRVEKLSASHLAEHRHIPVLDPVSRSLSILKPGLLGKFNAEEWLRNVAAARDRFARLPTTSPMDAIGRKPDLSGLPGHDGDADAGLNGLAAGLLGYRPGQKNTPSLAGLPGYNGADQDGADSIIAGLTGEGPFGKTGGLFGPLPGQSDDGTGGWQGALSDLLGKGPGRFGPNGFEGATPGSPYAPTGYLGPQGAWGDYGDFMIWTGKVMQGAGSMLGGAAIGALVTGAGAPAAVPLAVDGLVLVGLGAALEVHGANANAREQAEQQASSGGTPVPTVTPAPGAPTSAKTINVPPVVITGGSSSTITVPPVVIGPNDPPPPEPPKDEPHEGDLYPDPDGNGGGPTMIWDENGGGGSPNTMWDENGGGGTPNTIWDETGGGGTPNTMWDENFGGSGPKTRPAATFVTDMLVGPGLRAQFVQIGPGTIIY